MRNLSDNERFAASFAASLLDALPLEREAELMAWRDKIVSSNSPCITGVETGTFASDRSFETSEIVEVVGRLILLPRPYVSRRHCCTVCHEDAGFKRFTFKAVSLSAITRWSTAESSSSRS